MWHKIDSRLRLLLLLLLTSALLFMVVQLAYENMEPVQNEMPDGWTIIRPPHDVMALAIQGDTIWAGGKEGVIGLDREHHPSLRNSKVS